MAATLVLNTPADRDQARDWIRRAPDGSTVTFTRPDEKKRTTPQNAKMHAMIRDVQKQVKPPNGQIYDEEDWKRLFVNALWRETRLVPALDPNGGFVLLGKSTARMTTQEVADMILLIQAYGDQNGVKFASDGDRFTPPEGR